MRNLIESLKQFFGRLAGKRPQPLNQQDELLVQAILRMLAATHTDALSCEDVYEVLDLYTEAVARGEDVSAVMPLVAHHLEICGNCREEYEMLLDMVRLEAAA